MYEMLFLFWKRKLLKQFWLFYTKNISNILQTTRMFW